MATSSPLRYPGGKSTIRPLIEKLIIANDLRHFDYAEPYAGGCGLALDLLYGGWVSDIHINDIDVGIWSFWHSVLYQNAALVQLIEKAEMTVEEWRRQKEIHVEGDVSKPLELGFATFYLNRTNRSGIIQTAGVIGGFAQKGNYKMDCRFNRVDLIRRIQRVEKYKNRIHLSNEDALDFMAKEFKPYTFFCIDPPYFEKGSKLYTRFYEPDDHSAVASAVERLSYPWIVTYDNADEIRKLYSNRRIFNFGINYSVETKRVGTELMVVSKGMKIPGEIRDGRELIGWR